MSEAVWFVAEGSNSKGPYTVEEMRAQLDSGAIKPDTFAYGPGTASWTPIKDIAT